MRLSIEISNTLYSHNIKYTNDTRSHNTDGTTKALVHVKKRLDFLPNLTSGRKGTYNETVLRVFENVALRRIFGPTRDEVTGEWRRLRNEELNDLYSSLNIVRVIKLRRMRWAGHVARMGEESGVV